MNLDVCVVAFKDLHPKHVNEALGTFGYRVLAERATVHGDNELSKHMQNWNLGDNKVLKAVAPGAGWIVVWDPEKAMHSNANSCQEYSRKNSSSVIGVVCDSTSKTYGFTIFEKGEKVRDYLKVDGVLKINLGKRLMSELGLNLADKSAASDDMFEIFLGVTGIDLYSLLETGEFTVKELEKGGPGPVQRVGPAEGKSRLKFWK